MIEFVDLLQEFMFNLAVIILPIIAAFIVAALNSLSKKWLAELERAKPELAWYLGEAVRIAVAAAEQTPVLEYAENKFDYALGVAQSYLNEHGWDEVDLMVIEAAIEAEVSKL